MSRGVSRAKTCAKVIHILRIAHMWKGETSGAKKDGNLLELEATDASSGSDRRRGHVCRATLAVALCEHAMDAPVPLQQTQCISIRHGDIGAQRRSSAATDATRVWWIIVRRVCCSSARWEPTRLRPSWRRMRDPPSVGCVCCMGIDRWFLKLVDMWHTEVRRTLDTASVGGATDASVAHAECPTTLFEGIHL
jgi:hypothetical protein